MASCYATNLYGYCQFYRVDPQMIALFQGGAREKTNTNLVCPALENIPVKVYNKRRYYRWGFV
jgi:hypothetical protein